MAEIDSKIIYVIIASITGVYGWLLKHLSNSKKHICKDDFNRFKDSVQFKDVCASEMKGLDDCFSGEIKRVEQVLGGKMDSLDGKVERLLDLKEK